MATHTWPKIQVYAPNNDFQTFKPKSQRYSNTYVISLQINIDTTPKTPKITPSSLAHIEAMGFIGYMGEVFYAYLMEIHENSSLHSKSY